MTLVRDAELDIDLERAVGLLPPRQKLAVYGFYYVGLTMAETAVALGCTAGTVKSSIFDAKRNLRHQLREDRS